nr:MAG TPA: hypothetical protein [Microviridae sp.]
MKRGRISRRKSRRLFSRTSRSRRRNHIRRVRGGYRA